MKSMSNLRRFASIGAILAVGIAFGGIAQAAGPEIVAGPGADPDCFKPGSADTKYFQWPAKKGPYRIALANGFIANDWRVQMIRVAKAYAEQPGVKEDIKEFKVISVGEDIAAQILQTISSITLMPSSSTPTTCSFGAVVRKASKQALFLRSTISSMIR
jgi:ribose transport system substrate-binding protein